MRSRLKIICHNTRGPAGLVVFDLAPDQLDKTVAHIPRRNQEPLKLGCQNASGQIMEQLHHISGDFRIACEETEIFV